MAALAPPARTTPELPSLSHTAASTSVSNSIPASPTADTPATKDTTQNGEEAPINVEELAEELKDGDESDPNVSRTNKHTFSPTCQRR